LIGNPFVWYLSTLAVLTYAAIRGVLILREKRGYKDYHNSVVIKYDGLCGFLMVGWMLHYFPFYLMSRQLFLHHYFPALWFAILLICGVFDLATHTLKPRLRLQIAGVIALIALFNYWQFSPLAYGLPWTKAKCESAKWVKTWDFGCSDFHDNYSQYGASVGIPATSSKPLATIGGEPGGRPGIVVEDAAPAGQVLNEKPIGATASVISVLEPGHDIFANKNPQEAVMKSASQAEEKPVGPKEEQTTQAAVNDGSFPEPEAAAPPLPKEPGDLVTADDEASAK